ncbi:glutamate-5-semialdehyde dehydrogenase [Desulfofustis limnaeus]|jgi:glutamate-5-semialdehyde dehydrogenase|uniref:Gamma-glutamyl phosphate reductase n=1 Tax=Desulfofustis limnaeus TaxID=2740163 RepID=A0ABN6M2I8_9BACT|nr:glutamate-5-semialdehyde dehydrogenase [Desulfofustis limnaeus]MDX9894495.1 glutamate-5-semialdehyde dehydrogenase [Desulfofustis sp.]BDD87127.1 gamma-glutamyl phosphate reductase [Desulfofustis limnaeus]
MVEQTVAETIGTMARHAKKAARQVAGADTATKNALLQQVAEILDTRREMIQQENRKDIDDARSKGSSAAMIDRLTLSDQVFAAMRQGLREVCDLPDPVGSIEQLRRRPNGLMVGRMRVPLGVIGMVYESRPNVTIDAAALCFKAGNSVILRGGSEALRSNLALAQVLQEALAAQGLDPHVVQVVPTTDREAILALLQQEESLDLIIPRGGEGLIRFVTENSRIPVLKHYKGVCHLFVDQDADLERATPIIINSKVQRPGVCNALEGLLVHRGVAARYLPTIVAALQGHGVELFGCATTRSICPQMEPAAEHHWGTEFLDLRLCIKVVDSLAEAMDYIERFGSRHTEAILTENYETAQTFVNGVDASAVVVNAATRFNDGGQLGLGAEIGISTTKLHAYGPMGLEELTTRKFVVFGSGQVRE